MVTSQKYQHRIKAQSNSLRHQDLEQKPPTPCWEKLGSELKDKTAPVLACLLTYLDKE